MRRMSILMVLLCGVLVAAVASAGFSPEVTTALQVVEGDLRRDQAP